MMKVFFIHTTLLLGSITYVISSCNPGEEMINGSCANCKDNHFSNDGLQCHPCTPCVDKQTVHLNCSAARNRYCLCPSGTYLKDSFCKKCKSCPQGHVQVIKCGFNVDRSCRRCPQGKITNISNAKVCLDKPPIIHYVPVIKKSRFPLYGTILIFAFGLMVVAFCFGGFAWFFRGWQRRKRNKRLLYELRPLNDDNRNGSQASPLIKDLRNNVEIYEGLALKLNPENHYDWRALAFYLGYDQEYVDNNALDPQNATQNLLHRWSQKTTSTAYNLYMVLKLMKRLDAADIIHPYIFAVT